MHQFVISDIGGDREAVAIPADTVFLQVDDEHGNSIGVRSEGDGTFSVVTWDEEGEVVELSLVTFPPPGHMGVKARLDRYLSTPQV